MSRDTPVITIENLSKVYHIPRSGKHSFRGALSVIWSALWRQERLSGDAFIAFPALEAMNLTVGQGEAVAVIGRNGSGKSTLLQMIAGTLHPTTGSVRTVGRVSALLELGSGFNPEFSGLENVRLNASILGLSREALERKLPAILEFADIGDFIHQPVRTYSSGMSIRLAFAILTAVEPEILIIDEALSVGDAFFQSKCVRWLERFLQQGKTFICVSHDMFLIQRICRRGIVLNQGRVICDSTISEAVNVYYKLHTPATPSIAAQSQTASTAPVAGSLHELNLISKHRTGTREITIEQVFTNHPLNASIVTGTWLEVELHLRCHTLVPEFDVGFGFRDRSGQLIGGFHTLYTEHKLTFSAAGSTAVLRFKCKLDLKPQAYLLLVGIAWNANHSEWYDYDCLWDCAVLTVIGQESFWGLSRLPGEFLGWTSS
ncbi:MAG: ABC transporter ATP-binding protein [Verrucomicrobia bacterium]|nr:ABC transporter ATP-binding protein [Verrucomicrobiota bacterium]